MEEVTGDWRRLHNEEVHRFSSPNIVKSGQIKGDEMAGHVAPMGG